MLPFNAPEAAEHVAARAADQPADPAADQDEYADRGAVRRAFLKGRRNVHRDEEAVRARQEPVDLPGD